VIARSRRHRFGRRRVGVVLRPRRTAVDRTGPVHVTLTLSYGIRPMPQSFLIMPGDSQLALIPAVHETANGREVVSVPVVINVRVA